jgi:hypothetical protein
VLVAAVGVEHEELGARRALSHQRAGVLLQADGKPHVLEKAQVVRERRRVARVVELAEELGVGHHLPGELAGEVEELTEQRRLLDTSQRQHILETVVSMRASST